MIVKPCFESPSDLKNYIFAQSPEKYNVMNALGTSKFIAALWSQQLSQLAHLHFQTIWFTPGFIYGTSGTSGLPKWQDSFAQNIVFKILAKIGMTQNPTMQLLNYTNA